MNNKGFTLVELILVISVLAMLALLSTPSITRMIEQNKVNNYNSTIDSIINAASLYASNNRYELKFDNNAFCRPSDTNDIFSVITLKDLIDNGDISSPVKNFCTDVDFSVSSQIRIILNCKTRQFSYEILGLKKKENVTDNLGKIINNKTCRDLY